MLSKGGVIMSLGTKIYLLRTQKILPEKSWPKNLMFQGNQFQNEKRIN